MDFGLSEEQVMLQETVRGFVANECGPTRLREIFDTGHGHDDALWKGLAEMGLCGLVLPEEHGGAGLELLDLALVAEVLGEGALPGPFLGHSLACLALVLGGASELKKTRAPLLASGAQIGTIALAEGANGWEPEAWQTRLDGERLSGTKDYVPCADVADWLVVGTADGRLCGVERGAAGVTLEPVDGVDRGRPIFRARFDGTPATPLDAAPDVAGRVRDAGLVLLAAEAFGVASRLIDTCVAYAQSRQQFGQPIAQFQAVKHQIARLGLDIEPTRGLFWYAAYALDHLPKDAPRSAALAKAHITERAMHVAREAVELHGGIGFTWECDVQMWFKRAMFDRAFLGTPEVQRERCAVLGGW